MRKAQNKGMTMSRFEDLDIGDFEESMVVEELELEANARQTMKHRRVSEMRVTD